ncbi:hypothetical protein HZY62_20550 [Maribacter polysiphoniae]|uniref:Uncharacterized protein n=1 Tax=Maribacter polysiphoniae TaxID=429344 RepID=A0A316DZV2_9FLAO|nr:DUF6768 family protein [Maribacter polysiphoniae]MBD1262994.1 hypothetical protein [Maribacter polysiphoniae]PWK22073.1 hypothetical protein LX92_03426 [Maribacter polysiphoniae]
MNKETENIDELIKETLNKEEAKFYDELEEQNLIGKLGEVYKGKMGWLAIIMNVVHLVIFGLLIYCIIRFFGTNETNELIKWASAGFLCMIVMSMLKLYIWMQMDKNDILREMKKLELQVATLFSKLEN